MQTKEMHKAANVCPDEETLVRFAYLLLDRREDERVKHHIIECSKCMDSVLLTVKVSM